MKQKFFAAAMLTAVLCITLSACGQSTTQQQENEEVSQQQTQEQTQQNTSSELGNGVTYTEAVWENEVKDQQDAQKANATGKITYLNFQGEEGFVSAVNGFMALAVVDFQTEYQAMAQESLSAAEDRLERSYAVTAFDEATLTLTETTVLTQNGKSSETVKTYIFERADGTYQMQEAE